MPEQGGRRATETGRKAIDDRQRGDDRAGQRGQRVSLYFHEGVQAWRASYEIAGRRLWVQGKARNVVVCGKTQLLPSV